jgi:hypothetical protein
MRVRVSKLGAAPTALAAVFFFSLPETVQAQDQYRACYIPEVGAVYRIGETGLPADCLDPTHVEFSWDMLPQCAASEFLIFEGGTWACVELVSWAEGEGFIRQEGDPRLPQCADGETIVFRNDGYECVSLKKHPPKLGPLTWDISWVEPGATYISAEVCCSVGGGDLITSLCISHGYDEWGAPRLSCQTPPPASDVCAFFGGRGYDGVPLTPFPPDAAGVTGEFKCEDDRGGIATLPFDVFFCQSIEECPCPDPNIPCWPG